VSKKWKIFGVQTNIEWYDVKVKFKQFLRKLTYTWAFQELICWIFVAYMQLVYFSSKRIFVNHKILMQFAKDKSPLIVVSWHNRLMMMHFLTKKPLQKYKDYGFMALASRHGDGQFVGKTMEKFGLISIAGSSNDGRKKASRGIDIASFRKIFHGLKKGQHLGLTPDGPRGPNQKLGGELLNIARISGAKILVSSYSSSRFKRLKTWDKFTIPLPFSRICFYLDDKVFAVEKDLSDEGAERLKQEIEDRMNWVQEKSQEIANSKNSRSYNS
jgi:lysophospholipid acyltransferase (LPLAT)-like uncharacterized protein